MTVPGLVKINTPRSLKFMLKNVTQAIDIVRKKNNITDYPGIYIYSDQTPAKKKLSRQAKIDPETKI